MYEQIAARHERTGGNPADLHRVMMEEVLYGCDVMPSAIHITGSTLMGAEPSVGFRHSRLYPLEYGRQEDDSVKIGSLEMLQTSAAMTLFNMSDPAQRIGSAGEETAAPLIAEMRDASYDLVIMNPPFTSNTKHRDAHEGVVDAAFAAFDASDSDQSEMADRLKKWAADTCYHGHAGLASAFAALAEKKLRRNGVIALVLPSTAINGASWSKFRELIAKRYADITIVSIAASGDDMSFSSDTGIGECLVIGRRVKLGEDPSGRGGFITLRGRPTGLVDAQELSKGVLSSTTIRHLEDGPYGGVPVYCGDTLAGESLNAPIDSHENGWGASRILDASLAQVAHSLSKGKLWLPAEPQALALPIVRFKAIGQLGVHDSMLTMKTHKGPFTKSPPSPTATYPSLYSHNASKETRLICEPDSQLLVRPGMEGRARELWSTASRSHINRDFRFNSQPLSIATTQTISIGGRAWPNVSFDDDSFDIALAVWCNSTLGLVCYWWHSSRQQSGRGVMTRIAIRLLPVLDLRELSDDQLVMAELIFEEFRDKELKPAYLADADPNRALLDRRLATLGFERPSTKPCRLAAKWCAEPSVHGGKQRPANATLII